MNIREAVAGDAAAINALYNALIPTTTVAWTEHLEDLSTRRKWLLEQQREGNPVLVAEDDGRVVGFASYENFRHSKWEGYRFTVEHSVHVEAGHHGTGVGQALMETLIARAAAAGMHVMVGAIDAENGQSIRFHQKLGFTEVARMPELGFKFGSWLDLVLMQRKVGPG